MFLKQSPERDANGRPIRKSRRQTFDLKALLADDDSSDDNSCADNSDDESDEDEKASSSSKQHIVDNSNPPDEDSKDNGIATEAGSKMSDRTRSDAEPPKKRRKLIEDENEDDKVEQQPLEIINGDDTGKKSGESISPRSHGRKNVLSQKLDKVDDDVEKWAKAIIKYHQKTEDIRLRYVSCSVTEL